MNLRVEIDSICVSVDLEDAAWTPELIETVLRQCGDQAVRVVQEIGISTLVELGDGVDEGDTEESETGETGE